MVQKTEFQVSKDLLNRAGFLTIDRREEIRPQRTTAELEAEIKRLFGTEQKWNCCSGRSPLMI